MKEATERAHPHPQLVTQLIGSTCPRLDQAGFQQEALGIRALQVGNEGMYLPLLTGVALDGLRKVVF